MFYTVYTYKFDTRPNGTIIENVMWSFGSEFPTKEDMECFGNDQDNESVALELAKLRVEDETTEDKRGGFETCGYIIRESEMQIPEGNVNGVIPTSERVEVFPPKSYCLQTA